VKQSAQKSGAFQARQGDILIVMVRELPVGATPRQRTGRGVVLAEGEVTGHAHYITGKRVMHYDAPNAAAAARQLLADVGLTVEFESATRAAFLDVEEAATVCHEEHGAIVLPPGKYVVVTQREYTPERIVNVGD